MRKCDHGLLNAIFGAKTILIEDKASGASTIVGAYYHFTDARFTAWGKIAAVAEALDAAGWAYFDYELGNAIGECSEVLQ